MKYNLLKPKEAKTCQKPGYTNKKIVNFLSVFFFFGGAFKIMDCNFVHNDFLKSFSQNCAQCLFVLRWVLSISEHIIWAFFPAQHPYLSIFLQLRISIWALFSSWAFPCEHFLLSEHLNLSTFCYLSIFILGFLNTWTFSSASFLLSE